ncbi:hypothetical protein ACV3QT_01865 [Clostridium perfringens]|nr:hypothetical protein [Clostridium perfringens]MDK0545542.1 hypothetical protein [Clostridium perfringens]MDK0648342.1 hypothetical protein [Clostridium perfringens]
MIPYESGQVTFEEVDKLVERSMKENKVDKLIFHFCVNFLALI